MRDEDRDCTSLLLATDTQDQRRDDDGHTLLVRKNLIKGQTRERERGGENGGKVGGALYREVG